MPRTEFPQVSLERLKRFDRIVGTDQPPTPFVSARRQAPFGDGDGVGGLGRDVALHLEL
ncbi:hypothetical protein [Streptomyces sp. NPDC059176]|uniref:hypothetical protein n=1 Tax=unclassified Streptomyces TaxID=2593676 RepID=UPI003681CA30